MINSDTDNVEDIEETDKKKCCPYFREENKDNPISSEPKTTFELRKIG
jgi:hypothetical protein